MHAMPMAEFKEGETVYIDVLNCIPPSFDIPGQRWQRGTVWGCISCSQTYHVWLHKGHSGSVVNVQAHHVISVDEYASKTLAS